MLPTALGGDLARVFMLTHVGLGARRGIALILIERVSGVVALVMIATWGLVAYDAPVQLQWVVLVVATLTGSTLVAFFAGARRIAQLPRMPDAAREVLCDARAHAEDSRLLFRLLAHSLLLQVASISVSWIVAAALDVDLSFSACLALVPLVWLATLVPLSFGGIGVREAAFAYLLGTVGVSPEASLLVSLGTFASLVFNGVVGAVLLLIQAVPIGSTLSVAKQK